MIRNVRINRNASVAGLHTIRTANQNSKVWEYLRRFRSKKYCRSVLKREITNTSTNYSLLDEKAEEISRTVVQSEEYFRVAASSTMEIKPLLLYYGMVGLAKCLIISGDNPYTLSSENVSTSEHESHGLSWKPITDDDKSSRESEKLNSEFCYVKNSKGPGLYSLFRQCYAISSVPNDAKFTIKDLLSLVPEFRQEYRSYFKTRPRSVLSNSHYGVSVINDRYQRINFENNNIHLFKKYRSETFTHILERLFPELRTLYRVPAGFTGEGSYETIQKCFSYDDHLYPSVTLLGWQYTLQRILNIVLTDFDVLFLIMFILSNIVRYRQDKWSKLVSRSKNDEIFLV